MRFARAAFPVAAVALLLAAAAGAAPDPRFDEARRNGALAREGWERSHRYLRAWLGAADPASGLIPRSVPERNRADGAYWNGKDAAADNYPFLVLAAWFTDRAAFDGPLRRILAQERRLTARPGWGRLTDDYRFAPAGLLHAEPDAARIFLNSAEYAKDGLLAITEVLGTSAWSERMVELVDDSFAHAGTSTPFGKVPLAGVDRATGVEVSGDYLQVLARLYWLSGRQERYLEWGARLADLYLLPAGKHHPTRDFAVVGLRDHACEIVGGLSELYVSMHHAGRLPGGERWAAKVAAYRPHLHELLDRLLEVGRNADGLFYGEIEPRTGKIVDRRLSDSWGYVYDAYLAVFEVDGTTAYRDAAFSPFAALNQRYRGYAWEPGGRRARGKGGQDGYADAIEGALNLAHRLPMDDSRRAAAFAWIDSEIRELWSRQRADGFVERWYADGNFARTTMMVSLWRSQGVTIEPWREDVRLGAARDGDALRLVLAADAPWSGRLVFDGPRHREGLRLPVDWPRINQFPEWFPVEAGRRYTVRGEGAAGAARQVEARELRKGLPARVGAGEEMRLSVELAPAAAPAPKP